MCAFFQLDRFSTCKGRVVFFRKNHSKKSPHLYPLHSEIFRLCWLRRTTDIQNRILANWAVRLFSVAEKTLCFSVHYLNPCTRYNPVIKGLTPLASAIPPSLTPSAKIGWKNQKEGYTLMYIEH